MNRLPLLLCSAGLAMASDFTDLDDLRLHDLRLQVGLPPTTATVVTARRDAVPGIESVEWSRRGRWSLLYTPSFAKATSEGKSICLLEFASSRYVSDGSTVSETLAERVYLADIHLGLAWAVLPRATILEITGYGGGGTALQEGGSHLGGAWELGLRAGLSSAPFGTRLGAPLVGVAVLASYGRFRNQVQLNGNDYTIDIVSQGFTPALTVGWRF